MSHQIETLLEQLMAVVPEALSAFKEDLKNHFRPVLLNMADEASLVTREAFDAQVRVLAETRQRLDAVMAALDAQEQA